MRGSYHENFFRFLGIETVSLNHSCFCVIFFLSLIVQEIILVHFLCVRRSKSIF